MTIWHAKGIPHRTLFWAGDTFAPKLLVQDRHGQQVTAQQCLQNAFLDMFEVLARSVSDLDGVIGFEVALSYIVRLSIY